MKKPDIVKLRAFMATVTDRDLFHCSVRGSDNSKAIFLDYSEREIPLGGYFLCDCIGNTVDLCRKTERKFKNSDGRLVKCKVVETLIKDCHKQLGTAVNGCWKIPKL